MLGNIGAINALSLPNNINQAKENAQALKSHAVEKKAELSATTEIAVENVSNTLSQARATVKEMQALYAENPEAFAETLAGAVEEVLSQVFTVDNKLDENGTLTVTNEVTGNETAAEVDYNVRTGLEATLVNTRGGEASVQYDSLNGDVSIQVVTQNNNMIDINGSAKDGSIDLDYVTNFGVNGTISGSLEEGISIDGDNVTWQSGGPVDLMA